MISYPPPKFEQQKSEIMQRYQILIEEGSHKAQSLADSISLAMGTPFVIAALNKRYRSWYKCEHGFEAFDMNDIQTYFARMHLSQSVFDVPDVQEEEYFLSQTGGLNLPAFRSIAGVPLCDPNGKRFGTLCIADDKVRAFTGGDLQLLSSFGNCVSNDICVRSAARYAVNDLVNLEEEKCELFELATIDPLTKALNRRAFYRFGDRELRRSKRDYTSLTTLMLDIDHFKSVNDDHGHAMGDQVLAKLVAVSANMLRQEDLVGRLGGEEFGIVLVDTDAAGAAKVAERIRGAIKQFTFPGDMGPFSVTVSIGISQLDHGDSSINEALERADNALYKAKRSGRDRVEIFDQSSCPIANQEPEPLQDIRPN
ncbi:MAG: sensor domain-containing diguanylate cyclase [Henriciella sp.]